MDETRLGAVSAARIDLPAPARPAGTRWRLPRPAAFWLTACVLGLLLAGSAIPSPLYAVYQAAWHFSPAALTIAFGVYAIAVLVMLLVTGSLSDHLGRRPVILAALAAEAAGAGLFLAARELAVLYAARILTGLATGSAAQVLSASLHELQPARRPHLAPMVSNAAFNGGLAVGALGSSALVQYGPAPAQLVYWLLLAASLAGMTALALMPEPGTRRPGALRSLRPHIHVAPEARRAFAAAVPSLIAVWALGGLYLSLGPSVAAGLAHSDNRLWGGLVIFLLTGTAAATGLRHQAPRKAMITGNMLLAAGAAATVAALAGRSIPGFLAATTIAGAGFGLAFQGAFRALSALAAPRQRAALIAAIYIVMYLSYSLPVIAAGIASTHVGLRGTAITYAAAVTALAAAAAAASLATGRHTVPGRRPGPLTMQQR